MRMCNIRLAIFVLVIMCISGCTTGAHLSGEYGQSYNKLFARQILNPGAPNDPSPPEKMPGDIATQIYNDLYIYDLTTHDRNGNTTTRGRGNTSLKW